MVFPDARDSKTGKVGKKCERVKRKREEIPPGEKGGSVKKGSK